MRLTPLYDFFVRNHALRLAIENTCHINRQ